MTRPTCSRWPTRPSRSSANASARETRGQRRPKRAQQQQRRGDRHDQVAHEQEAARRQRLEDRLLDAEVGAPDEDQDQRAPRAPGATRSPASARAASAEVAAVTRRVRRGADGDAACRRRRAAPQASRAAVCASSRRQPSTGVARASAIQRREADPHRPLRRRPRHVEAVVARRPARRTPAGSRRRRAMPSRITYQHSPPSSQVGLRACTRGAGRRGGRRAAP